ncbi:MAG: protein-tyrosine sulfotransferase [Robiginitomaculum sp.]|nr:MAG: protein-tyrosine sulfotransferase [Robiginitomaculum sp.]
MSLIKGLQKLAALQFKGVHGDAIAMIRADVNDPVPYCLLGFVAAEHGNHIKAGELFARASTLAPGNGRYLAFHAQALTVLGQHIQATQIADKAAEQPINDAYIADTIGVVYSRTGFHEKAVPFFEKAVKLDAGPANFHYNLAASQQFLGNFISAKAAYRETIDRDPHHHRAWSSLIGLEKQTASANHIETLLPLFEELSNHTDAALHFGHAIAKSLEDLGQYPQSLDWLRKAKVEKRASLGAKAGGYDDFFAAAKQLLVPLGEEKKRLPDEAPIFIFGLPRTGTTLVDRILSSHRDVTAAGELNMFAGLVKEAVQSPSNMVLDADTLIRAAGDPLSGIGQDYLNNTKELARGAMRMTDKMPLNFFYAGLIHRALPNARLIALRRGAMDSCLSNYRQLFTVQYSYYNYTFSLEETARFYRGFDDLICHWRRVLPADRFMEVCYEDIVLDQENQTRKLLDFCDLSWDSACLRFHENTAPVSTASSVQVRQPLYTGSIGRWKKYGKALDGLKNALGDLADQD